MQINIHSKALTEGRIKRLAVLVGRHHRHVLGDLLFVWSDCFERRTAFLSDLDIDAQVDVGFARAMVAVGLAEELPPGNPQGLPPGTLRVMGVAERLEWLLDCDAKRQKANETRKRNRDNKEPPGGDAGGVPARVHSDIATSPSLIPDLSLSRDPTATQYAVPSAVADVVPPHATPDWSAARKAIMREVIALHVARFNALRTEIDADVRPLSDEDSLRPLRELLNGYTSLDGVLDDCRHAISVGEAEARRTRSLQFFGSRLWSPKVFAGAKGTTRQQARDGPQRRDHAANHEQPIKRKALT